MTDTSESLDNTCSEFDAAGWFPELMTELTRSNHSDPLQSALAALPLARQQNVKRQLETAIQMETIQMTMQEKEDFAKKVRIEPQIVKIFIRFGAGGRAGHRYTTVCFETVMTTLIWKCLTERRVQIITKKRHRISQTKARDITHEDVQRWLSQGDRSICFEYTQRYMSEITKRGECTIRIIPWKV
jgi:hypothetical protein